MEAFYFRAVNCVGVSGCLLARYCRNFLMIRGEDRCQRMILRSGGGVIKSGAMSVVFLRLYLFCFSFVEVRRPLIIFHSTGYPSDVSVLIQSAPLLSILICGSTCRTSFINRLMRLCASPVCCPSVLSSVWFVLSSSSSSVQ